MGKWDGGRGEKKTKGKGGGSPGNSSQEGNTGRDPPESNYLGGFYGPRFQPKKGEG